MAIAAQAQEMIVPEGGIADFVMSDESLEQLAQEEGRRNFGDSGIAEFQDYAGRMAKYGRGGDEFVAHLAPGEIVVPAPLIANNPELRDSIFGHLRELGIEDPEQYVVGSAANSINPDTGLMEFGFFSSIVKSVGKIVKKAAPIVLPMVLAATPLGPVFGAALGSGIASFISGGDMGDALKAAAISGGIGAVTAGFTGQGTFGQNVKGAVSDPVGRLGKTGSAITKTFNDETFFQQGDIFGTGAARYDKMFGEESADALAGGAGPDNLSLTEAQRAAAADIEMNAGFGAPPPGDPYIPLIANTPQPYNNPGFLGNVEEGNFGEALWPSGPTDAQVQLQQSNVYEAAYKRALSLPGMTPELAAGQALKASGSITADSMGPGMFQKYGPAGLLAGGAAVAGGLFDTPPEEELNLVSGQPTGADLFAANPEKYALSNAATTVNYPNVSANDGYTVDSRFNTPEDRARLAALLQQQRQNPFVRPLADGGEVYPRRTGGIMPNEGVPGQDSVRAMLMPGEFVMTTDAVNGAGGINNMYDMMRGLERRERAMS